jgi:Ca2+-transporting ATPase
VVAPIHTAVKGRVRYKVTGLRHSASLEQHLAQRLTGENGIREVSPSAVTGNVLVLFDPTYSHSDICSLVQVIVSEYHQATMGSVANPTTSPSPTTRKTSRNSTGSPRQRSSHPTTSRRAIRRLVVKAEEQKEESWHLMDADAVAHLLGTTTETGLSAESVRDRLKKYGPNLLPESIPRSGWSIFIGQLASLPVALLGVAAGISLVTGGLADALVILGVVAINATIGYATESQSEGILHSLKTLVRPSAQVLRDGKSVDIPSTEVVTGDVLMLKPGSYVAADARLIEATRLSVDESTLTGESMPVTKNTASLAIEDTPLGDRLNMVYMGTLIVGGQGLAVVVATARFTEMGKIQTLVGEAETPETPMERQLDQIGSQLVLISGAVCGGVFVIGLLRGYGVLQMLKTSISLAVAAVPEGLPTIATTTLALGINRMRQHHVLIRKLNAVETLGSVQTICLDKTGTLTHNRMTVVSVFVGMHRAQVTDGEFRSGKIRLNPFESEELRRLLHACILCNEVEINGDNGNYVLRGSPTEMALLHTAITAGIDPRQLRERHPLLRMTQRAENRNFMSTFHRSETQDKLVFLKGSPSEVLALCHWHIQGSVKLELTEEDRLVIQTENDRMASEALRVLGVAYKPLHHDDNDGDPIAHNHLIWLGLTGMTDPLREGVKGTIGKFHQAGIDTVMITGDQSPTAYAIGKELQLSRGTQLEILDSTHLTAVNPDVMMALSQKIHVFARVSPAHKLQIVQALQRAGKVVAMTGDGINDGPALKAADIGIAMGHTGTDVAREVADVVLEDDNLDTMIIAISEGRTIYNNIRKSVHFLLATNLSEIMVMSTSLAAGFGQPLNAMQLLWINLMSDIAPGLALALEAVEPDILSRPPRSPEEPIVRSSDFQRIGLEAAALSAGSLGAYGYGIMRYGIGPQAGTLCFSTLTLAQLLHAVSCRSETHSIFSHDTLPPNPYLTYALGGSTLLQILTFAVPGLRNLLGLTPITLLDGLVIGGCTLVPFVINEQTKPETPGNLKRITR